MSKARDIADLDFNAPDIDGGNIDGAVIGGTTAAAGTFTTLNTTGAINAGGQNVSNMNNATAVSVLSTNGYWVGGTQRINGSGDLINIGDIGASGNVTTTAQEPTFTAICSDTSLTANQYIGGFKFQKTDPSGAGAGVLGGIRMRAEDSVGANAYMQFSTGWSGGMDEERARFTSAGSFLVGTTSSRPAEFSHPDGFSVRADVKGQIQNTVTNAQNAILNRDGSDGQLLLLRREGAEVGNIGTANGDLNINGPAGHSGIRFQASSILPRYNGADTDGTMDIGYNDGTDTHRWRNLYLSGGVVFGPASASNVSSQTLSSYEEGSWSPVLQAYSGTQPTFTHASGYTPTGVYTKVGRLVTVEFYLPNFSVSGTTSGTLVIAGLPFTAGGAGSYNGPPVSAYNVNWARSGNVTLRHYAGTRLGFLSNNNSQTWNWEIVSAINNSVTYIVGSITYATHA